MAVSTKIDTFFDRAHHNGVRYSYSDVRLETYFSNILPANTDLRSRYSRRVSVRVPLISSPMDKVTEWRMAIAMASMGGLGIIHRACKPEEQARQVARVKHHLHGLIQEPITVRYDDTVGTVLAMREGKGYTFHSFPVLDGDGKFVGLVTESDFRACSDLNKKIADMMTHRVDILTVSGPLKYAEAHAMLCSQKRKVLPVVKENGMLNGMYILSDLERIVSGNTMHNVDGNGQLLCGAAVGVGEGALDRARLLAEKKCDVFVIDSAHGNSQDVFDTIRRLKAEYPDIDVVAGNVSTEEGARYLAQEGADGIQVGQGPGSICTTRIVAGVGTPQASAVYVCAKALRGTDVPVCADGGIAYSGDIPVAIAIGADTAMMGLMFAGTDEAPGEPRMVNGVMMKDYRGMGSAGAMRDNASSRERYRQVGIKSTPEGVEALVPLRGPVKLVIEDLIGGLRDGMGYRGAENLAKLRTNGGIFFTTASGQAESHPHHVHIPHMPHNYSGR